MARATCVSMVQTLLILHWYYKLRSWSDGQSTTVEPHNVTKKLLIEIVKCLDFRISTQGRKFIDIIRKKLIVLCLGVMATREYSNVTRETHYLPLTEE